MTICPKCKGRATKLYNINTGIYTCQQCKNEWTNEYGQNLRNEELKAENDKKNKGQENNASLSHSR